MLEGLLPDLLHAFHSFVLFSLSFLTIARAGLKASMLSYRPLYPSQSGHETQPWSRYVIAGDAGMLLGRFPDLHHSRQARSLSNFSFLAYARDAANESISVFTWRGIVARVFTPFGFRPLLLCSREHTRHCGGLCGTLFVPRAVPKPSMRGISSNRESMGFEIISEMGIQ